MYCTSVNKRLCPDFKRGDTLTIVAIYWQTEEKLKKVSFSEGMSANAQIRNKSNNSIVLEADSVVINTISSSVTIVFDAASTQTLIVNRHYVLDIELVYSDGTVGSTEDINFTAYKDRTFS